MIGLITDLNTGEHKIARDVIVGTMLVFPSSIVLNSLIIIFLVQRSDGLWCVAILFRLLLKHQQPVATDAIVTIYTRKSVLILKGTFCWSNR